MNPILSLLHPFRAARRAWWIMSLTRAGAVCAAECPRIIGWFPRLEAYSGSSISFGPGVSFQGDYFGAVHLRVETGGALILENGVYLNNNVEIGVGRGDTLRIGAHTKIGPGARIFTQNFHPVDEGTEPGHGDITIGRNCWIGMNAHILCRTTIGDHSVISAGSVVKGIIPPKTVAAGNYARVVREIECSDNWVRP